MCAAHASVRRHPTPVAATGRRHWAKALPASTAFAPHVADSDAVVCKRRLPRRAVLVRPQGTPPASKTPSSPPSFAPSGIVQCDLIGNADALPIRPSSLCGISIGARVPHNGGLSLAGGCTVHARQRHFVEPGPALAFDQELDVAARRPIGDDHFLSDGSGAARHYSLAGCHPLKSDHPIQPYSPGAVPSVRVSLPRRSRTLTGYVWRPKQISRMSEQ
jgi:hypothetical protein